MVETSSEVQSTTGRWPTVVESAEEEEKETPDVYGAGAKIQRAKEVYSAYAGVEEKPSKGEVLGWFLYGLCSYFVHTVLIPVVFPLIISQIRAAMPLQNQTDEAEIINNRGFECRQKEILLYQALTNSSITINSMKLSPLEWTSVSWVLGLIIAAPILGFISVHLDYGRNQQLIAAAATSVGALFCLPAGFFKTTWIFPPYIAAVVAASTIVSASHTRHLGLMVRGFIGSTIRKSQFADRRAVAGWLSLYSTAAGCLGAAMIGAFVYHMLSHPEKLLSLWIVSIFSGLIWAAGIVHVFTGYRRGGDTNSSSNPIPKSHALSIFTYPHAAGSLAGVFLSSVSTMCIFTGSLLFLMGQLCFKPPQLLYLSLIYFLFPLVSLPLMQPLQNLIRADAVKMQLLGLLLTLFTSGIGFYYRFENWKTGHVMLLVAVQSVATGILHAFARVLLLDCSPPRKEGAFAVWFSWVRSVGACLGFVVASSWPGNLNKMFGVAFCFGIVGVIVLIFGNISSFGGAIAAGHVREYSDKGSPVCGLDNGGEVTTATQYEEKMGI